MFNSELKKEWLARLESARKEYANEMGQTQSRAIRLFEARQRAVSLIGKVEILANSIPGIPKTCQIQMQNSKVKIEEFVLISNLKNESEIADTIGGIAGASAAAGAGIAVLGPTAAIALATTFGTASTGTAIASLSGVAASNAALAWLGGGALAAGGGGMAAGSALLALAGPIGLAIGGLALLGGAIFVGPRNRQIAEEAQKHVNQILEQIPYIIETRQTIVLNTVRTEEKTNDLTLKYMHISNHVKPGLWLKFRNFVLSLFGLEKPYVIADGIRVYSDLDEHLKAELNSLLDNALTMAELVELKIG